MVDIFAMVNSRIERIWNLEFEIWNSRYHLFKETPANLIVGIFDNYSDFIHFKIIYLGKK